ncbi:hypothetical protein Tfer_0491 [Thermincola ferriacetica]|uniref:Uncharacterized protein n=2 Tax=Thermincola TaxID=278993 RepID=D5X7A5_THEPJ|nr:MULTISPECIES: general stress protein [Thermincola]ADG82475.1 conserved hypothetical protein [Thermincola potens JR]KNZ70812.1 hypothetical protein Tfer_0491 [Thermincola ferriacetica]
MRRTIVGLFKSLEQAENALKEIEGAGYANSDISIVAQNTADEYRAAYTEEVYGSPASGMPHDVDSFLVQAPAKEVPFVGPVSAAGPFAEPLINDNRRISEVLTYYGVSPEKARELESKVAGGHVLTVIQTDNSKASNVANILSGYGAFSVEKWSKTIDKPLYPWNGD